MKRTIYVILSLIAAILLAYSHVWQCDFINYDDNSHVYSNEHVRGGLSVASITWAFTHFHASQWIPLTWLSFMADVSLFGLDPGPMHLVNVGFHCLNSVLLLVVLWQMTGAFWRSAVVAALFALHPVNVETVAWITERKSLLNTSLWLLAIYCYARYVAVGKHRWLWLTTACMAFGIMSKAMIVTLPFTLLLLDFWPVRRHLTTGWPRLLLEKLPLFALSALMCVVQVRAGITSGLLWSPEMAPVSFRLACAAASVVHYTGSLFYPAKLSIQYPMVFDAPYELAALGISGMSLFLWFAWQWRERAPYLLAAGLWFLGTLVPVSGIVRAGDAAVADRYTYVPQIGFFIVVVWFIGSFVRVPHRPIIASLTGLLLAALTFLSANQVKIWTNSVTLFSHAAETWPTSYRAQELAASAHSKAGNFAEAARHSQRLLEMLPRAARIRDEYGVQLAKTGDLNGAIQQFRRAAADDPSLIAARFNLGTHLVLQEGGRKEAISVLQQMIRERPEFTILHYWLGKAFEAEGRLDEAKVEYIKRLEASPSDTAAANAVSRLDSRH